MAHKRTKKDLKKQIIEDLAKERIQYGGHIEEIMNCKTDYIIDTTYSPDDSDEPLQSAIIDVKKFQHAFTDDNTYDDLIKRGVFKEKEVLDEKGIIYSFHDLLDEGIVVSLYRKGEGYIKPKEA